MVSVIKLDNSNGNPWSQYFNRRSEDDHDDHQKWGLKKFFTKALLWNHYVIKYSGNIDKGETRLDSCVWLYCLTPSRKIQWLWNPMPAMPVPAQREVKNSQRVFHYKTHPKGSPEPSVGMNLADDARWSYLAKASIDTMMSRPWNLQKKKRGW